MIKRKEPQRVEGPTNFVYLAGDPGDGINRKILLLGDLHIYDTKCKDNSTSMIDFLRYIAFRLNSSILDLFLEFRFVTNSEELFGQEIQEGKYIYNLIYELKDCLTKHKEDCKEPMRIHYVDTRYVNSSMSSFSAIYIFLKNIVIQSTFEEIEEWSAAEWPEDVEKAISISFDQARLSENKLKNISSKIREKFKQNVLQFISVKLSSFYKDRSNMRMFYKIKEIVQQSLKDKKRLSRDQYIYILHFYEKFIKMQSHFMDAYFVYRLLKKATDQKPDRPSLALHPGQNIKHVVGYMGNIHTFQVRDLLLSMGFNLLDCSDNNELEAQFNKNGRVPDKVEQCLEYSIIKETINDFCKS